MRLKLTWRSVIKAGVDVAVGDTHLIVRIDTGCKLEFSQLMHKEKRSEPKHIFCGGEDNLIYSDSGAIDNL